MFNVHDEVCHLKTKRFYEILGTPDYVIIEKTKEHSYAYRTVGDPFGPIWIRGKEEMEDGRFVKV